MIKTRLCSILNIEYPIFQGGMAWVSESGLASAVSNAGGLGVIACGNASVEYVRDEIDKTRKLTDRPFGVNVLMVSPHVEDIAKVVADEKVPIVITGAGNPGKYIEMWKNAGIKVIPVIPTVSLAIRMQRYGADSVIAEGCEAGGHIGELTTMALVPQVADALDIPVIAAGGIGDGRGVAASLMLGAQGVQVGTRFLVADECKIHEKYKKKVLDSKDSDTVVTGRAIGYPVRILRNKLARQMIELEKNNASSEEYEKLGSGALMRAVLDGDVDYGSVMAGQIAGLICKKQPASDIIKEMFLHAECIIEAAGGLIV